MEHDPNILKLSSQLKQHVDGKGKASGADQSLDLAVKVGKRLIGCTLVLDTGNFILSNLLYFLFYLKNLSMYKCIYFLIYIVYLLVIDFLLIFLKLNLYSSL